MSAARAARAARVVRAAGAARVVRVVRPRAWSIRTRTAIAFAVAFAVLATALLAFVNLMSVRGIGIELAGGAGGDPAAPLPVPVPESVQSPSAGTPSAGSPSAGHSSPSSGHPTTGTPGTTSTVRLISAQLGVWSLVGIAVAAALAGGVGWFVSRRMLRPVDAITAAASRISASTLHERIALDGPDDELRRMARTLDELIGRLERSFAGQRHFVAQASHELRTPLAVQRAAIQIGLDDDAPRVDIAAVRDELLTQNRRTECLVEHLLLLAEAEAAAEAAAAPNAGEARSAVRSAEPIDLDALVDDVLAEHAGRAHDAGVRVARRTGTAPPGLCGDAVLVRQLLRNLVDNAIDHNRPGGAVLVVTDERGLAVENDGAVVDDPEAMLEPFRRGRTTPSDRPHSGMGLSIVAAIARAHGWRLRLTGRPDGGLAVRVDVSSM